MFGLANGIGVTVFSNDVGYKGVAVAALAFRQDDCVIAVMSPAELIEYARLRSRSRGCRARR